MFCPTCGSEERQASQFCRACGVDLRAVRLSLERPDSATSTAVSAREEIGRAVAEKIRAVEGATELKIIADSVLPQVEKFLESPGERRLRRMRAGVIISSIGLGASIFMGLMAAVTNSADVEGFVAGAGAGVLVFFIGLGVLLNALLFTRPRNTPEDLSAKLDSLNVRDPDYMPPQSISAGNSLPNRSPTTSNLIKARDSVTEHTTLHLKSDR
jgi:hypothetical protein